MKTSLKFKVGWLVAIVIAICLIYQVVKIADNKRSRVRINNKIPDDYESFFNQINTSITHPESYLLYNANFYPVSNFNYNNDLWVVVTKFKINEKTDSLPNINIKQGKNNLTENKIYTGFDKGYFRFYILPDSNIIKNIDLMVDGNSIEVIKKTKNLAMYSFNLKSMSLSYDGLHQNNLNIETSTKPSISSVILAKRGQSLYFIFISQIDPTKNAGLSIIKKMIASVTLNDKN